MEDAQDVDQEQGEQHEDCEIDQLMLTAQEEHDQEDETKRASCGRRFSVSAPVSRAIFVIAKARGAKVIFASDWLFKAFSSIIKHA